MTDVLTRPSGGATGAPPESSHGPGRRRSWRGRAGRAGGAVSTAAQAIWRARSAGDSRAVAVGSASLAILGLLLLTLAAELTVVGSLRHSHDQATAYDALRATLANAVTPVGPIDGDGHRVAVGTPIAVLSVPSIGLREVVGYGTTSTVLMSGPGLRRDSVFPGQPGVSVILGRRAAYGGPFAGLGRLHNGAAIDVVTGQGHQTYQVIDVRRTGDPIPPAPSGTAGLLTLETADGPALAPTGVLRVDARLLSAAVAGGPVAFGAGQLPPSELTMAGDTSVLMPLVLWVQALLIAAVAFTWARMRWGGWQTWIVALPTLLLLTINIADHLAALLPNLI